MSTEDCPGSGDNKAGKLIVIKHALLVAAGIVNLGVALIGHAGQGPKDRVVLKNGGDDPIANPDQSQNRDIQSLG